MVAAGGGFTMYSEDMKYAFEFTKDGAIRYGKFAMDKLDYVWQTL